MPTSPPLSCQELPAGPDLWERLRPTWRLLLEETGESSAFLSEAWVGCWLDHFGATAGAAALVWSTGDGAPVACVLRSTHRKRLGRFPVSRSYLNASGVEGLGCEHNDILTLAEHRAAVVDDLSSRVRSWGTDELVLEGLRKSFFNELLERWPTDQWQGFTSASPYVDLDRIRNSGEGFLMSLSSNSRSQIRRSLRLYEELYGEPDVVVAETVKEAQQCFSELVALHEATWRERGEEGAFARPHLEQFYRSLIERTVRPTSSDGLKTEMVRIRFGDETTGVLFNLVHRGTVAFYQSGFSYKEQSKLKPGLVSHTLAIEHYLARGEREYDFLGGEALSVRYKRSLSNHQRDLVWVQLQEPSLKMRLIQSLRLGRRRILERLNAER